jgi:two-component system phosphate regulon sensor histidine kinase PhoR
LEGLIPLEILILDYNKHKMKSFFDFRNLLVQMITAFIVIVILTSATVGVPAIWLLQNQVDRQAWAQVEQGQRVTIALYASHYKEILDLATLTAQRPTLQELLAQNDITGLTDYLITLQSGAGLDRIVICDHEDRLVVTTDPIISESVCETWKTGNYQHDKTISQVCLTAYQSIENQTGYLGEAFVCSSMDDNFEAQLRDQTGLEHILWIEEIPVSTSLPGGVTGLESIPSQSVALSGRTSQRFFEISGVPYYAAHIPLDEAGLKAEVVLDVTDIVSTRTRLVGILITSILGISLVGSILGVLLARRISRPLVQLSESATSFSLGDLESPVYTETSVREITQVAKTLENARVELLASLTFLQDERDWSEHLLASIVEGIITLDGEGRITFFSHGAERVTGWSDTEVIGRLVDDTFQLAGTDEPFSSILPSVSGGRQKADVLLADDRIASLAITGARLTRSGERKTETALVFRDISEEEAVHRLLGQFLANVAHEFRTPLSALEASIELLLDQAPELSTTELQELHTSLHLGILGLHTLVDNLLESANIEARRFRIFPRASDLGNIIADAAQTMQPLLAKYEQHLTIELPMNIPVVQADSRRTVQVLINLLSNASRYGPPGEEINLRVTADARFARVAVIDRGPGIPPEQRANLFRRFVFPHADDVVSQAGAGLGLSVVKAIVTAHGGQVGVDDWPGGGTIFWFTLPIDEEAG